VPSYENYDELFIFQQRNQKCIYSYQSALSLHGLTDRVPFKEEVTVPQGYNASHFSDKVTVHFIIGKWYMIGQTECLTEMGNKVRAYDMERTVCDLIRSRAKQDPEIFSKAIHLYLKRKDKDIWKLRDYAKVFGLSKKLEEILEVAVDE
jgi:predicted transcriptional regulator of viral defense system